MPVFIGSHCIFTDAQAHDGLQLGHGLRQLGDTSMRHSDERDHMGTRTPKILLPTVPGAQGLHGCVNFSHLIQQISHIAITVRHSHMGSTAD